MIVRCDHNTIESAARNASEREVLRSAIHLDELSLAIGRAYRVFAIAERDGETLYYICPDDADAYPTPWHSAFFSKVDASQPPDWETHLHGELRLTSFREWARNPNFYEGLIDDDPTILEAFQRARASSQPAKAPPDRAALAVEGAWVQCPDCLDAWEAGSDAQLLQCPGCGPEWRRP